MRIVRTSDMGLIREIMTSSEVYPYITDDGSPLKEDFDPIDNDSIYYLLVMGEGLLYGLYMLHPHNSVTYEIHTCLLRTCRGKKADKAAKEVLKWIFSYTPCLKVVTHVPESNKPALKYAQRAGLIIEGVNRESFLKGGKLYNQVLLGITREESCQQQQ